MDNLIIEAITNLKDPSGSDRAAIAAYIEVHLFFMMGLGQKG